MPAAHSSTGTSFLFGLAPCGVCPARRITAAAVRSYRTFSPLPWPCGRGGIFSVVLAVTLGLNPGARTLSGTLLCGVRTFLPPLAGRAAVRSGCLQDDYRGFF